MKKTKIAMLDVMGSKRPYGESKPIKIVEAELDEPGPGEILVKMVAAGLCHSDLSVINGDRPRELPLALGHEASAIVVEVGEYVTRFEPGDHVVLVFAPSCGHCVPCAEGRPALCQPAVVAAKNGSLLSGKKRIKVNNKSIDHHIGVSAFSEYAVVHEGSCVKIDKDIPLDYAAMIGCAVMTGVGAVMNTGKLRPGQTCAIVGLGGVGLAALQGAVAAGAKTVIAVDIDEKKFKFAKELGADHAINPISENAIQYLMDITGGGVDLAVEVAGSVAALKFAYDITKRGGNTVTAGLPHPDAQLSIAAVSLTANEKSLKGSYMGSCVPIRDIPSFAQMMVSGKLPIEKLLTNRIKLKDINEGFERLAAGEEIRQLIIFD